MPTSGKSDPEPLTSPQPSFENAMAELEAIVQRMESGDLALEESLQSYRRGAELIKLCQTQLASAQQQVRILEGGLLKPFNDNDSAKA